MNSSKKIALSTLAATVLMVGCGEGDKFADKEYTDRYLMNEGNEQLLVDIVEFCDANKNANLNSTQMRNCDMANFVKHKLNQKWSDDTPTKWDRLVEQYGKKANKSK